MKSDFTFVKWLSHAKRSIVAEVTRNDTTPMALKILSDKNLFQNEKTVLEHLGGQHHTLKLEQSFSLESLNCYGLLFRKYEENRFLPKSEAELCSYMYQLFQVSVMFE